MPLDFFLEVAIFIANKFNELADQHSVAILNTIDSDVREGMLNTIVSSILILFSVGAYAAVIETKEEFNYRNCVNIKANQCINACINSSDMDCSQRCREGAKASCQDIKPDSAP